MLTRSLIPKFIKQLYSVITSERLSFKNAEFVELPEQGATFGVTINDTSFSGTANTPANFNTTISSTEFSGDALSAEFTVGISTASFSGTALDPAFYNVGPVNAPDSVDEGESFDVSATVDNTGEVEDTQTIRLLIDGVEERSQSVNLDPATSTTVTFESATINNPGDYTLEVDSEDDAETTTITVNELAPANFDVTISDTTFN